MAVGPPDLAGLRGSCGCGATRHGQAQRQLRLRGHLTWPGSEAAAAAAFWGGPGCRGTSTGWAQRQRRLFGDLTCPRVHIPIGGRFIYPLGS
eukprot:364398-Chlamydomonas_euryale.AAC.9